MTRLINNFARCLLDITDIYELRPSELGRLRTVEIKIFDMMSNSSSTILDDADTLFSRWEGDNVH